MGRSGLGALPQPHLSCPDNRRLAVRHLQLIENVGDMIARRLQADEQAALAHGCRQKDLLIQAGDGGRGCAGCGNGGGRRRWLITLLALPLL